MRCILVCGSMPEERCRCRRGRRRQPLHCRAVVGKNEVVRELSACHAGLGPSARLRPRKAAALWKLQPDIRGPNKLRGSCTSARGYFLRVCIRAQGMTGLHKWKCGQDLGRVAVAGAARGAARRLGLNVRVAPDLARPTPQSTGFEPCTLHKTFETKGPALCASIYA